MRQDSEYIYWLMIEQLTGDISEADYKYLSNLLDTNTAVREAYKLLQKRFSQQDLETKFERLKVSEHWKPMSFFDKKPGRVLRLKLVGLAAAILAGMVLTIYILRWKDKAPLNDVSQVAYNKEKTISLQLAGGKTVYLSKGTGQMAVGNGTLLNGNSDSLSFIVNSENTSTGINTLRVPVGLDYKITLLDGTSVWLNSSTTLKFSFNFVHNDREISIDGEAYVEVAKDANKPFIVHTEHGTVKVSGTRFNINTYNPDMLRVSLVEGSVQVNADDKKVKLKPGDEAVYSSEKSKFTVQRFDQDEVLSWRQGVHHFYDNTVHEICEIFPRWYGVHTVIDNRSIKDNRFTGILNRNEPLDKFLHVLKATASINDYEYKEGELHLK